MPLNTLANNAIIRRIFKLLSGKIDEAPANGKYYLRRNGQWVEVPERWDLDTLGGTIVSSSDEIPYVKFQPHWDDLRVPVTATKLGGSKDPDFGQFLDNGLGSQGVFLYRFDPTQEQEIYFAVQLPHTWIEGTAILPHVHWVPITNNSGDVIWGLEYALFGINETSDPAATTIITATAPSLGNDGVDKHLVAGFGTIDMSGKGVSTMLLCRLFRDAGNAADTYTGDAGLLEIDFHYQLDSLGSSQQFSKT